MSTTPLPPLPVTEHNHPEHAWRWTPTEIRWMDARDAQWQAYVTQSRADLEAENKRLRAFAQQVLKGCLTGRVKSQPILIEDLEATELKLISLADAARAALEGTK